MHMEQSGFKMKSIFKKRKIACKAKSNFTSDFLNSKFLSMKPEKICYFIFNIITLNFGKVKTSKIFYFQYNTKF